ncbi:BAR adaptor protein [Pseudohyphozyma bogoriensis]|nr:BAR adaptor protein [Pseudohyphozyma bogoriensis]
MLRRTISRTTWLTQNPYRLAPLVYKLSYNPPPPATPSSPAVPEQPAPPPPASTRASTNSSTGPFSSSLAKAPTTTPKKESAPKAAPKPSAYRLDRPETSELPFRHSSEHLADINYELVTQGERIDKAEKSLKKLVKSEERKIEELARIVEVLQESREGQWERRAKSFGWPLLTDPPLADDVHEFVVARRQHAKLLLAATTSYHKTAFKKRAAPDGTGGNELPVEWLGREMVNSGAALAAASESGGADGLATYATALDVVGNAHLELSSLTTSYLDNLSLTYVAQLEQALEGHDEFSKAIKDADKLRSSLEASLTKAQKAKSSSATQEEELENLRAEYDTACDELQTRVGEMEDDALREAEALGEFLEAEIEYAQRYTEILLAAQGQLPNLRSGISSKPRKPAPPPRTRSGLTLNNLAPPSINSIATRMGRSYSDSSAMKDISAASKNASERLPSGLSPRKPTFSFSSSGSRSRSHSTAGGKGGDEGEEGEEGTKASRSRSGSTSEKVREMVRSRSGSGTALDKVKEGNRSRSGSMLGRFSSKKASPVQTPAAKDDGLAPPENEAGERDSDGDSYDDRSGSKFTTFKPTMPQLPSLKKLGSSTSKYESLDDDGSGVSFVRESSPVSSSSRNGHLSATTVRHPSLKRHATSPSLLTTSALGLDDEVGKTYRAQWQFAASEANEVRLEKGDTIKVTKVVNSDWWIGRKTDTGEEGMFPSAYVTLVEEEEKAEQEEEKRGVPLGAILAGAKKVGPVFAFLGGLQVGFISLILDAYGSPHNSKHHIELQISTGLSFAALVVEITAAITTGLGSVLLTKLGMVDASTGTPSNKTLGCALGWTTVYIVVTPITIIVLSLTSVILYVFATLGVMVRAVTLAFTFAWLGWGIALVLVT